MASTKRSRVALVLLGGLTIFSLGLAGSLHALATDDDPLALTEAERLAAISQNCPTIKQTLNQLERADSRTRTYLGAAYETISTKFIAPLSLRLTRNNYESASLLAIQAEFSAVQTSFRIAYTDYMRELDALIATDCSANPQDFSTRLEATREKRAQLKATTTQLSELAARQYQAVSELKEAL